jgi:hypothetical protein
MTQFSLLVLRIRTSECLEKVFILFEHYLSPTVFRKMQLDFDFLFLQSHTKIFEIVTNIV